MDSKYTLPSAAYHQDDNQPRKINRGEYTVSPFSSVVPQYIIFLTCQANFLSFSISLMTSIELTLIYVDSLINHFNNISDDRLLAMSVNPLQATRGFDEMIALVGDKEGEKIKERAKKLLTRSVHELAKGMLEKELPSNSDAGCEGECP